VTRATSYSSSSKDRTVLADNSFSLKNARFEAPRDLRNRKVQVRFDREVRAFERSDLQLDRRRDCTFAAKSQYRP
jgi:hypothetical protein